MNRFLALMALTVLCLSACGNGDPPTGPKDEPTGIEGRVVSGVSADPSGVLVIAEKTDGVLFPALLTTGAGLDSTLTDAVGNYRLLGLEPGTYTISAAHPHALRGYVTGIEVNRGAVTKAQDLYLVPTGAVSGTAVPEGETDRSGVVIFVAGSSYSAYSDSSGAFLIDQVPVGIHELMAARWGFTTARTEIVVTQGDTTQAGEIVLSRAAPEPPRVVLMFPADQADLAIPAGPPIIPAIVPELSAREVAIYLQFSRAMNWETVLSALQIQPPLAYRIFLNGSDALYLVANTALGGDGRLRFTTAYSIKLDETATDIFGQATGQSFERSFTTGGFRVVRTFPEDGDSDVTPIAGSVSWGPSVGIWMNASSDPSYESGAPPVSLEPLTAGSWSYFENHDGHESNRIPMFIPDTGALRTGTHYVATVAGDYRAESGETLGEPFSFAFQTQPLDVRFSMAETVGPLKRLALMSNTVLDEVALFSALSATADGIGPLSLWYSGGGGGDGSATYHIGTGEVAWPAGSAITVVLPAVSLDHYGASIPAPISVEFQTTAAMLLGAEPADGTVDVWIRQPLRLSFNTRFEPRAVQAAIEVTDDGDPIDVQVEAASGGGETMDYYVYPWSGVWPREWPRGAHIVWSLSADLVDPFGKPIEGLPASGTFDTMAK